MKYILNNTFPLQSLVTLIFSSLFNAVVRHLGIAPISRFGPRQLGIPSCRTQSRDWLATGIATWRPLGEYWRSVSAQLPRQLAAFETYLMAHYGTEIFTDVQNDVELWNWEFYSREKNAVAVPVRSVCSSSPAMKCGRVRHQVMNCCLKLTLAPKLTSHACALWVFSPPAAIAVTPAISQTSICKALGIDSPSQAQMNKHRHKTWSFCLKYCILSMSSKISRQMVIFFSYDSFCWTKLPTATGLGSRNDAM